MLASRGLAPKTFIPPRTTLQRPVATSDTSKIQADPLGPFLTSRQSMQNGIVPAVPPLQPCFMGIRQAKKPDSAQRANSN